MKETGAEGRRGGGGKERETDRSRGEGGREDRERAILRTWFLLCTVLCSSFVRLWLSKPVSLDWQTTLTGRK